MVYIDLDSLVIFISIWGVLAVLFSIGIRGSRKKDIKDGKQTWLTKRSPKALSLGMQVFLFLLLIIFIGGRILFSTLDISNLTKNIQTCDKVVINHHFHDLNAGGKAVNSFILTDKTSLNSFSNIFKDIISSNSLNRVVQIGPLYYTDDFMEIEIYQQDKMVNFFVVNYSRIETQGKFVRIYASSAYPDSNLLGEFREKLLPWLFQ
jgi:hypothetical protein